MLSRIIARQFSQSKLIVSLVTPHSSIVNELQVDQVNLQTERGDIGILPDHVPIVEQLKPGIVELLHEETTTNRQLVRSKWFISGGFMAMHPDGRLDISTPEAITTDQLNPSTVGRGLQTCLDQIGKNNNPKKQARLEIEHSVYKALSMALDKLH